MIELQSRKIQGYGWRRQHPDARDHIFDHDAAVRAVGLDPDGLPTTADLRPKCPPVYDQAQLGSCTGNGTAAIFQFVRMLLGLATLADIPSRLFIYFFERFLEGGVPQTQQDSGAEVRDGLKVLATYGCPEETLWPYSDANPGPFQTEPPADVQAAAKHDVALVYEALVPGHGALKSAIAAGFPVVFGFSVPDYFEDTSRWNPASDVLPAPDVNANIIGGHCVVLVGYDEPGRFFWVRNSWGDGWGKAGYFRMSFDWFHADQQWASDFWVLRKAN